MFYWKEGLNVLMFWEVMRKIVEYYDVLCMVYVFVKYGYEVWNWEIDEGDLFSFEVFLLFEENNVV